jgi:hypothetical protein
MSEILVTFDKLTVIIGVLESLRLQEYLEEPGLVLEPLGLKGSTVWRRLERAQNIDLGEPEIIALMDLLVAIGALSADARQRIADYVATATPAEPTPPRANYRVPVALAVGNPYEWIGQFCDRDRAVWEDSGYLMIATDGDCNAPGVEVLA